MEMHKNATENATAKNWQLQQDHTEQDTQHDLLHMMQLTWDIRTTIGINKIAI